MNPPFRNLNILILSDHDPGRICGHTIHLQYLSDFLKRWNRVRLAGHAWLRDVRAADVVWIRSEKLFLRWIPFCALTRRKTVYDLASFPWLELEMAGRSRIRILLSRWTFQLALKTAVVRVLSASMSDYLKTVFRIPEDRMFVLPIPIRLPAIRRKGRSNGRLHFVYMGSEKPWQGFRNLIDAFARLESDPLLQLHCYGIRGRNTKNVRFHENVPSGNDPDSGRTRRRGRGTEAQESCYGTRDAHQVRGSRGNGTAHSGDRPESASGSGR